MSGTLITLLSFGFVLGVLVFVHELGHFLAAKRVGIRVLKFQLGFNPTVFSFQKGDTEYSIGALPLGGYVKMAGDNPDEGVTGAPDEFLSKSKWERFQVLIMGPTMNLALAVVLTAGVLYVGAERFAYEDQPVVVGSVTADSPAARAGFQPGDRVIAISDRDVKTWEDFYLAVGTHPNKELSIRFERDGVQQSRLVTPEPSTKQSRFEIGDVGLQPNVHPHIRLVRSGEAAERAGLKANDVVLTIDGETITFSSDLKGAIVKHPDEQISMSILREGAPMTVLATPGKRDGGGFLGIDIADETVSVKPGLVGRSPDERRAQRRIRRSDFPDDLGTHHPRNLAEAADGTGCHGAAVRRIGAARCGGAFGVDGSDQPEPWVVEPVAHPHPRWWPHLHHGARGARPS